MFTFLLLSFEFLTLFVLSSFLSLFLLRVNVFVFDLFNEALTFGAYACAFVVNLSYMENKLTKLFKNLA